MKATLVRKVGQKLFDGRTNVKSTPGTTTATRMARPTGRKFVRTLKIFASALLVYSYATFVVLFNRSCINDNLSNVRLARTTLADRINGVKNVCITVTALFFTCDDVLKGCCCKRTGVHFFASQR